MFIEKLKTQDYKEFIEQYLVQNKTAEIKNVVQIAHIDENPSSPQHNCAYVAWERQIADIGIFATTLAFTDDDCRVISASDSRLEYLQLKQCWVSFLQSKFENYKHNQQDQEIGQTK